MGKVYFSILVLGVLLGALPASAGEADVVGVEVRRSGPGTFSFDVTVRHDDQGWQHYADRWDVVGPDGTVIASRKLLHPHDTEQPFTRSLGGVRIGKDVRQVVIRAHDSQHGLGGASMTVDVPHGK